jgi:lipoprotein-anchoring transpeptidase ErfK/SrfK
MREARLITVLSGAAAAALMMAALAACDDFRSNSNNSAPPAKVASAAPPATAGNVIASAGAAPPVLVPPIAANAVGSDASAQAAMQASGQASGQPAAQPAPVDTADLPPAAQAINQAAFPEARTSAPRVSGRRARQSASYDATLLRVEVLLDRAGFSPGAIDGRQGTNLKHALSAYAEAHGATSDGTLDAQLWSQLSGADSGPVVQAYKITDDDEKGPFIGTPPKDYQALAKLPALSYSTPEQALAERFHMSQKLLEALNPKADFTKAGTLIVVTAPRAAPRDYQATRIEVDKSNGEVRAFGADGKLAAAYPATVGSTERPAPSGQFAVASVAPHPAYFYDPSRLTFTPTGAKGKLRIAPGPNNPVGSTWIALTIPTYGIHGAPDPTEIGKQQSHGCIRLTNWDAAELGHAVKKGVPVNFVGTEKKPGRARKT